MIYVLKVVFFQKIIIIQVFDFQAVHSLKTDCELSYLLATAHATWHHSGFTQVGRCSFIDRSDTIIFFRSVVCLIW